MGPNYLGKIPLNFKHLPITLPKITSPLLPLTLRPYSFPESTLWVLLWVDLGRIVWKGCLVLFLQCQPAVIPLGTGKDLAHFLGWGAFWNKNKSPLNILNRVEQACVRILDRRVAERSGHCGSSSLLPVTLSYIISIRDVVNSFTEPPRFSGSSAGKFGGSCLLR